MGNAKIERQYMGKMTPFRLAAPFQPMGDQPEAVKVADRRLERWTLGSGFAGCYGYGKNFHDGKSD